MMQYAAPQPPAVFAPSMSVIEFRRARRVELRALGDRVVLLLSSPSAKEGLTARKILHRLGVDADPRAVHKTVETRADVRWRARGNKEAHVYYHEAYAPPEALGRGRAPRAQNAPTM